MIDKVWLFDINRRVYAKDENGRNTGGPIWREHWREHQVVEETRVSYITKNGQKVPKNGGRNIAFSEAEIDRLEMIHLHAWQIADAVKSCKDPDILIEVAQLIGYQCRQTAEAASDPLASTKQNGNTPLLR